MVPDGIRKTDPTERGSDRFLDTANPQDDESVGVENLDSAIQRPAAHCGVAHHLSRSSPRLGDCPLRVGEFQPDGILLKPSRLAKLKEEARHSHSAIDGDSVFAPSL